MKLQKITLSKAPAKLVVILLVILAVGLAYFIPSRQLEARTIQTQILALASTFPYKNDGAKIDSWTKPANIYIFYWSDSERQHASLVIDGIWVEIASVPKP